MLHGIVVIFNPDAFTTKQKFYFTTASKNSSLYITEFRKPPVNLSLNNNLTIFIQPYVNLLPETYYKKKVLLNNYLRNSYNCMLNFSFMHS